MRPLTRAEKVLRIACVCALVGLALMVWSVLDPSPMPVILGLSVGQGVGTLSFLLFLVVVAMDLRVKQQIAAGDSQDPSS